MRALAWLAPAFAAVLVNVQLQLPTAKSSVTANLADPIVIVAGLTMLLFVVRDSIAKTLWRIPHFNLALGLMAATLIFGFFHGWIRFGLTDWALYNRLVGLGIVLCYLLTGALATASAGSFGTRTLVRALIVSCATIVFAEWLATFFLDSDAMVATGWFWWQFSGLLGNRNAFALVLLLALAVGATNVTLWQGRRGAMLNALILGLLAWGVYLSGSRAGAMAGIALLVFLFVIPLCRKRLWRPAAGAAVVAAAFWLGDAIFKAINGTAGGTSFGSAVRTLGRFADVQSDRMASLVGGLQMWLDHPVFGGGLGAFMHDQLAETGIPLVIHNSFLWLLAEFGVIGFVAFLAAPGLIVVRTLRTPRWVTDWPSVAAMACIVVLAVVSLTHDVAYQRVFWLLIGALVARPGALKAAQKRRRLV
jgi:O-antigen ligase